VYSFFKISNGAKIISQLYSLVLNYFQNVAFSLQKTTKNFLHQYYRISQKKSNQYGICEPKIRKKCHNSEQ